MVFRIGRLSHRAVLLEEHDALVAVKGSPLTHVPVEARQRPKAVPDTARDDVWFGLVPTRLRQTVRRAPMQVRR